MTEQQEAAMRQALEALEGLVDLAHQAGFPCDKAEATITALRQALEQEKAMQGQEPKKFDPNESFEREEANQARVREFMRNH